MILASSHFNIQNTTMATPTRRIVVSINGSPTDYRVVPGTTAVQLAGTAQFRENFGLAANIVLHVNGREDNGPIPENAVITIIQTAARKAAAQVRVKIQVNGGSTDHFLPHGVTTTAQLAANREFRETFGLGDNIALSVGGVEDNYRTLRAGDVVTVNTTAARKAL